MFFSHLVTETPFVYHFYSAYCTYFPAAGLKNKVSLLGFFRDGNVVSPKAYFKRQNAASLVIQTITLHIVIWWEKDLPYKSDKSAH